MVNQATMTRVDLIVMAIGMNPTKHFLYGRLAELLPNDETAKLPDGRILNRNDCLQKASQLRDTSHRPAGSP